jgi:hypothetical protein
MIYKCKWVVIVNFIISHTVDELFQISSWFPLKALMKGGCIIKRSFKYLGKKPDQKSFQNCFLKYENVNPNIRFNLNSIPELI